MPEIRDESSPLHRVHTAGPRLSLMAVIVDMENSDTICECNLQGRPHGRRAKTCSNQRVDFVVVILNKMVSARQNEQPLIASSKSTRNKSNPFRRVPVRTQEVVLDFPQ
jgi:hypothetical protein